MFGGLLNPPHLLTNSQLVVYHTTHHIALKRDRSLLANIKLKLSTNRSLQHHQRCQCTADRTLRPFSNIVQPTAIARVIVYRTEKVTPTQKKFQLGLNVITYTTTKSTQRECIARAFGIRPCCCVCKACPHSVHFDVTYQGCLVGECYICI